MKHYAMFAAMAALLAACSGEKQQDSHDPAPGNVQSSAASANASPAPGAFAVCTVCHTVGKGEPNRMGPNLFGTYGAQAGVHPAFNYSPALKSSGVVWTEENLHKWLEKPAALIPGNRMAFAGVSDPAKRQQIIDYLKAHR